MCYIIPKPVKLWKKKIRICTFVQVSAKRFRLCPTYKATLDKGSLNASYYFSKIAQSKKKKKLKEKELSRKRESLSWKIIPYAGSKKIHKRRMKAFTKISEEAYLDSRISAGPQFLLSFQEFICARLRKTKSRYFWKNIDKNRNFRNYKCTWELPES